MRKVLFACYGSGHVRMVLPVARALHEQGLAEVRVLALTTAAPVVVAAGLPVVRFKDVVGPPDAGALDRGRSLLAAMGPVVDQQESAAYLGLSYQELVDACGEEEAARRYARDGRQAFLPTGTLRRILEREAPDLLVATNSPRAERAAVVAAGELGIPAVCMVDLFALDEVRWIGRPGYAQRVCVLNEAVRRFLIDAGRSSEEVVVTGNPAFDGLADPALAVQARTLRKRHGWDGKRVLLWPTQVEPAVHPFDGRPGDTGLPARVLGQVVEWVLAQPRTVLCVRERAGEAAPELPSHPRIVRTGQDWPLPVLLHAVDLVVTLTSTVGLEGHLAGCRVLQVCGSMFDDAMPLLRFGMADAQVPVALLEPALAQWSQQPRRPASQLQPSAPRVLDVLRGFL